MLDKIKDYIAKYSSIGIFLLIIGVILTIFLMRNRILDLKDKFESEKLENVRIQNNYDASLDTIKVYKDKNGNLVSSISAYQIKYEELDKKYSDLFKLYIKEKNKEPLVIIEYRTKLDEKITNVSTLVTDTSIYFIDSIRYSDGSYRSIEGNIPYKITYHIKKNMVSKFAFEKALYFAYVLEENGVDDAKVVAFNDNKIISIKEALKVLDTKNLIYRIKIEESDKELSLKSLSDKYKIDQNILTQKYENNRFIYYAGNITSSSNVEPIIDNNDMNVFSKLYTDKANLNLKQGINLYTGLVKDTKTNKILINVKSDYPGITFTNIVGADIMGNEESKKITREFRKEFGIGLNLGYGFFLVPDVKNGYVIKRGPSVSIGLNWTPKFLQFGN